jgi:hypothetical protein
MEMVAAMLVMPHEHFAHAFAKQTASLWSEMVVTTSR